MFDHAMRRGLAPLAAAMMIAACHEAPTLPTARVAPRAHAASIAPPAGTFPLYQQSMWLIVDQNDNEIWQNVADAPLSGGYFTIATARPGFELTPCSLHQGAITKVFQCDVFLWERATLPPGIGCDDDVYPIAMWTSSFTCYELAYNPNTSHVYPGERIQVIAAPTAPGGLVFRRWEVRIAGDLLPCAEGTGSLTCTVTAAQDYAFVGPTFKLVYGNPVTNQPPVAAIASPPTATVGAAITFNASGSTDPEHEALTYAFDFGDGSPVVTGANANVSHSYAAVGAYTVSVVVRDPEGLASQPATTTANVQWPFTGFFAPIANPPSTNKFIAGLPIVVSFSLGTYHGRDIFAPGGAVERPINCSNGSPLGPSTPAQPVNTNALITLLAGFGVPTPPVGPPNGLVVFPNLNRYVFAWQTERAQKGCRELILQLRDGTSRSVRFQLL